MDYISTLSPIVIEQIIQKGDNSNRLEVKFDFNATLTNNSTTCDGTCESALAFERMVRIAVPVIFSLIVAIGLFGNLLVIIVVVSNKQMRNTTNLLIINLAVADLFFIAICVPFTATSYAMSSWPFGTIWCKVVQYFIHVCAYASVYTLVLMSMDRFLAVVHPVTSMTIRTERNAYNAIALLWIIIFLGNIHVAIEYKQHDYVYMDQNRSACLNLKIVQDPSHGKVFYGIFFSFGFAIPLTAVCFLYGFMLKRLLYGVVPGGCQSVESIRSKKRVTRMVVIVMLIFAICWLPLQVILLIQYFGYYPDNAAFISAQIASQCLAYMNSCVNPILYAFLSENFRKSFRKLLCMGRPGYQNPRFDFERTNARSLNDNKSTTTSLTNTNGL